jgi:hypothetical protein
VKVAVAEGYAPIPCTSGIDGGAMGVHYVNGEYLKDEIPDIKRLQAVMFHELHVRACKANPRAAFADMNPRMTCEHAHGKPRSQLAFRFRYGLRNAH